jgi:hypothetical protein
VTPLHAALLYRAIYHASVPYLGRWHSARHAWRLTVAALRAGAAS